MKTTKKKKITLKKLKIASLIQVHSIKGGTRGRLLTNEDLSDCRG